MSAGVRPLVLAVTALWVALGVVSQVLADPPLSPVVTLVAGIVLTDVLILGYGSTLRGPRGIRRRRRRSAATDLTRTSAHPWTDGDHRRAAAERTVALLAPLLGGDAVAITDQSRMLAFTGPGADHHGHGTSLWTTARDRVFTTGETVTVVGRGAIGCPEPSCPLHAATIAPLRVGDATVGTVTVYRTSDDPPAVAAVAAVAAVLSLTLEQAELEATARRSADARLEALRAQINPHFLFNTLNTIASRVRTDPQDARGLLVALADFFRYAVRQDGQRAEFAQEFAFVRTYVALEQARFGDRLEVAYDVDPQVLGVEVPILVIQPLVENAIKHGVAAKVGRGRVTLRARVDPLARVVDVHVTDDGIGMSPSEVQAILRGDATRDGGVGLRNIAERLDLLYGDGHRFDVRSSPGHGTTVRLRIPM